MSCKMIRELIFTDYIDNEISDKDKIRLNIHFANCRECKEFSERVKNAVVEPFAGTKKMEPPEFIWHRVRETIVAKQEEKPSFVFSIPKPALAMSALMALVLIVMLATALRFSNKQTGANKESQGEYSIYSLETPSSALLNNDAGFGTSIEDNFL